jgi:hypothetical protein
MNLFETMNSLLCDWEENFSQQRTGRAGGLRRLECAIAEIGAIQMNWSTKIEPFLDRSFIIGAVLPARTAGGPSKKPCFISRGARQTAKKIFFMGFVVIVFARSFAGFHP